jgi:hypothetical protein
MGCVIPGDEFATRQPYTTGMDTAFASPADQRTFDFARTKKSLMFVAKCRMGYLVYDSSAAKPTDVDEFQFY